MKILLTIFATFLLLGFNYSYAEGDPEGCKWIVTEETDQYIMESCGTSNARIRQKHNIETIFVPQKEKLVNPIEETNNPSWKTKKPIGPTVTVGPFLKYILDEQYKRVDLDGKLPQGDLFPDINVNDLRTTIQNKIHKTGGV